MAANKPSARPSNGIHDLPELVDRLLEVRRTPPPELKLKHTPGWQWTVNMKDGAVNVFSSEYEAYGFNMGVFVTWDTMPGAPIKPLVYYDLDIEGGYGDLRTPDDLTELAGKTDQFRDWLTDCATVMRHLQKLLTDIPQAVNP